MKKLLSLMLAATMLAPLGTVGAAAYDDEDYELAPGGFNEHGKYIKSNDKIVTQHLMFAMPGAWQNEITMEPRCNGAAGLYWWMGWDNPEDNLPHGWPGYTCDKVEEEGVDNLYAIDAPNFGNGEKGNGTMLVWNNNIDGGAETDPAKNPFREAAQQTRDFQAGYYSRYDQIEKYEDLFRYIYKYNLEKLGVDGASDLNLKSETFWEDINKVAAAYSGMDYDKVSDSEKEFCVDAVMDVNELDFSVFGEKYASNFFNSDTIQEQYRDLYPEEEDGESCISFNFDNMVFVINFDPDKMVVSPISHKIAFDGDFYFYYGGGAYGTWPTKELNEEMGGESGNFAWWWKPPKPESGKIYFDVASTGWKNFKNITCCLYDHDTGEQFIVWGSKKGNMTDEGNGIWSIDLAEKGCLLSYYRAYEMIFTADWVYQTGELIVDANNIGDTAYCTGEKEENTFDHSKQSQAVKWRSGINGSPVVISSTGEINGEVFRKNETAYSLFAQFMDGQIDYAVRRTGKSYEQMISDLSTQLGLSSENTIRAVRASGREIDLDLPAEGIVTCNGMVFEKQGDHTLRLIEYTGSDEALTIPKAIRCGPVSKIDRRKSTSSFLLAWLIPTYEPFSVTAVGDWAFANNKTLKRVDIPDSVTSVGKGAFYNCVGLQSIILPDSVTSLGANAFEKCLYLESAVLGDGITAISDETFFDCRRLTAVNIPDSVSTIGAEAFYNCRSLREAALPNGVHSIGSADNSGRVGVFEECRSLEKLLVPDSITSIEPNAFDNCLKLSVYGSKASYAESFAASEGIAFKNIGNVTASAKIIGDFNCDLELTVTDATDLQRFLAEMLGEEAPDLTNPKVLAYLDVNGDGAVTISDVTMVQQFLAEMITSFR